MFDYLVQFLFVTGVIYFFRIYLKAYQAIKPHLAHLKIEKSPAIQPKSEVIKLLEIYNDVETAWGAHNAIAFTDKLLVPHVYLRPFLLQMHLCSRLPDELLNHLLEDQHNPPKSKAFYQYLRPDVTIAFSETELKQIPPLLKKMVDLQHEMRSYLRDKNWQGLRLFLKKRSLTERLLINWMDADLSDAHLVGAPLHHLLLVGVNFNGARLEKAELNNSYLKLVSFKKAQLFDIDWQGTELYAGSEPFKGAHIDNAVFEFARKSNCRDFSETRFVGDFKDVDFSDLTLVNAEFNSGLVFRPCFSRSNLTGLQFKGSLNAPQFKNSIYSDDPVRERIERAIVSLWMSGDEKKIQQVTVINHEYKHILKSFELKGLHAQDQTKDDWLLAAKEFEFKTLEGVIAGRPANQVVSRISDYFPNKILKKFNPSAKKTDTTNAAAPSSGSEPLSAR